MISKHILLLFIFFLSHLVIAQESIDSLIVELDVEMERRKVPGAMVTIVTKDSIIFSGGLGFANVENQEKVSSDDLFRMGSISKSITALGLFHYCKNNSLSLDTPIREIDSTIPFKNKWEKEQPITIAHVLEHTTGFDEMHLHAVYNTTHEEEPDANFLLQQHRKSLVSRWKPGTRKSYSNPNYVLAGYLLEHLTGEAYSSYIKREILQPLAMEKSNFFFKEPQNLDHVKGYKRVNKKYELVDFARIDGGPAGSFSSTANEMVFLLQFFLNQNGLGFQQVDFERIEQPQTDLVFQAGLQEGYGLGNFSTYRNGFLFHGHNGAIDGFSSRFFYSREADIGVSVCINRVGDPTALANIILDFFVTPKNTERSIIDLPSDLAMSMEGFYVIKNPRRKFLSLLEEFGSGTQLEAFEQGFYQKKMFGRVTDTLYYAGNSQFYVGQSTIPKAIYLEDSQEIVRYGTFLGKKSISFHMAEFFAYSFGILWLFAMLIVSFIWLLVFFIKKKKVENHNLRLTVTAAIYSCVFIFTGLGFALSKIQKTGMLNVWSVLAFISSILFIFFTLATLIQWTKELLRGKFKFFYLIHCAGLFLLLVLLYRLGLLGLRLWAY